MGFCTLVRAWQGHSCSNIILSGSNIQLWLTQEQTKMMIVCYVLAFLLFMFLHSKGNVSLLFSVLLYFVVLSPAWTSDLRLDSARSLLQELYISDHTGPWENFSDQLLVAVEVGAERSCFLILYVCLYQLSTININLICPLLLYPNVRPISVSDLLKLLVRLVAVLLYFVAPMWYRSWSFLRRKCLMLVPT